MANTALLSSALADISRLRKALIETGRAVGAGLADDVSTDFLMLIPEEVRLKVAALRASAEPTPTLVDQISEADWAAWDASGENALVVDKDGLSAEPTPAVTVEMVERACASWYGDEWSTGTKGDKMMLGHSMRRALEAALSLPQTREATQEKRGNFVAVTSPEPQLANYHTAIYEDDYKGLLIALCNQNGRYPWQAKAILDGLNGKRQSADEIQRLTALVTEISAILFDYVERCKALEASASPSPAAPAAETGVGDSGRRILMEGGRAYQLSADDYSTLMAHGLLASVPATGHYRLATEDEMRADPGSAGVNHAQAGAVLAVVLASLSALPLDMAWPRGRHARVEHDGFAGVVIGHYTTLEGKPGVVLQLHGARVVHVYGEKWLTGAGNV